MIINEIQLTNIGAYKGVNSFDFRPKKGKSVILIGGENGAGKTTLLNAIKLGLFGSYGYGYKTENADYYKKVESILNQTAKKNKENDFRIRIDFSLVDNFEKIDYRIYRHWTISNQGLREKYDLVAGGHHLSEYEKDVFQSKLKEVMPPHLLDFCLFDGEEIARIVNEDLLSNYLENLSRVVFNLDIFETLENDLETYSNQNLDSKKMDSLEQELYELNNQEKELKYRLNATNNKITNLLEQKEDLTSEYNKNKNDFEKYGGLAKIERDEVIKEINNIEITRKQNSEKIKEFVSILLPFYLAKDLVHQTRKQIQNEESIHLYNQLETRLTDEKLDDLIHSINGPKQANNTLKLKEKILDLMKPEEEIIQIQGASFSESSLIENMYLKIKGNTDNETSNIILENKNKLGELQELKEKLKVNDTTNEFSEMIKIMERNQKLIHRLNEELTQQETHLYELTTELETVSNSIDRIQNTLRDSNKIKSSFLESQKIITLSRRFREIQLKKKLQEVQIEASNMLKKIMRKHNYISTIIINPESYDVKLLDFQKEYLEKSTLSAGEKEILLISIIWAIFKCSGRKVPFIFDTLLGRLDKTHKVSVLREFIPNCSKQAIILSTDTEIDEDNYIMLHEYIAKEYMLDFNVEKKQTRIINQYFPFRKMELSI